MIMTGMGSFADQRALERAEGLLLAQGFLDAAVDCETARGNLFAADVEALGALILQAQRSCLDAARNGAM